MARVFITGSADGLGQMAATLLVNQGNQVVLHARNAARAQVAFEKVPGREKVLIGDLSSIEETKQLAEEVNALGSFDAVIHNAGVYRATSKMILTVNTLAPYILTCLIEKPKRLIYLSSGMHTSGDASIERLTSNTSYSDSKLQVLMLAMAAARKWPDVYSNAVDPGWVATKMGGTGAPDDLDKGAETQAWLAVSNDNNAKVSGHYFYHQKQKQYLPVASDVTKQEKLLSVCEQMTGVHFPE
jgi:NAD(P)-dependent dehydrogenase (short-subunit alcohol dehydrogenase family)